MQWLVLITVLGQNPVFSWQDARGESHFSDDRSAVPKGVKVEVMPSRPREINGLMPPPEPMCGPLTKSQWHARFEAVHERRRQLMRSNVTSRTCTNRTVEVTVAGAPAHQQQVSVSPCANCEAKWVWVRVPEEPPKKANVVVQDCVDAIDASAQAAFTDALVAVRADETALTDLANAHQVPLDWRQ